MRGGRERTLASQILNPAHSTSRSVSLFDYGYTAVFPASKTAGAAGETEHETATRVCEYAQ